MHVIILCVIFLSVAILIVALILINTRNKNGPESTIPMGWEFPILPDYKCDIMYDGKIMTKEIQEKNFDYFQLPEKRHTRNYVIKINQKINDIENINIPALIAMNNCADLTITSTGRFNGNTFEPSLYVVSNNKYKDNYDVNDAILSELKKYWEKQYSPMPRTSAYLTEHVPDNFNFSMFFNKFVEYKEMLSNGLPIRICDLSIINGYCIYDDAEFSINNKRKCLYPASKHKHSLIPSYIPKNIINNRIRKIPKRIFQTFESNLLDKSFSQCVQGWITLNNEYEYNFFTGADRRDFIKFFFDEKVFAAYDTLNPGAYKADLWRLCVLYEYGGVYADIKLLPNISLDKIIDDDNDAVLVIDRKCPFKKHYKDIYNAFMAFIPKHPFVKKLIDRIVENVENRYYGTSWLGITGPKFIGEVLREELASYSSNQSHNQSHSQLYNKSTDMPFDASSFNLMPGTYRLPVLGKTKFLIHKLNLGKFCSAIHYNTDDILIYRRNIHTIESPKFLSSKSYSGKPCYEKLFVEKKVYYSPN